MFDPKQLAWAFITWGIIIIAGNEAAQSRERYYPHCSPIAHEIQQAWQRGEIRERDARGIIERCLQAEDRGVFEY